MKNVLFMALAMATTATFFSSCKKEIVTPTADLSQLSDADLAKKIGDFRAQVLDARKNGSTEMVNFSEALFLMEASFNYYHGFTGEIYKNTTTETIKIPVSYTTEDAISMNDLSILFVDANNLVVERFNQSKSQDDRTIMFDVELIEGEDGNNLEIMMTKGTLDRTTDFPQECTNEAPFGDTDYWKASWSKLPELSLGKCHIYEGEWFMQRSGLFMMEHYTLLYRRGDMNRMYFVDLLTVQLGLDQAQYFGELINYCINPGVMNGDFQQIGERIDIEYWKLYNIGYLRGCQFANIVLEGDTWVAPPHGASWVRNWIQSITYGRKVERPTDPYLPEEL
jgi:hypothetical protein